VKKKDIYGEDMDCCWILDLSLRTRCEFFWENFGIPGKEKSGMKEKERKWKERKVVM